MTLVLPQADLTPTEGGYYFSEIIGTGTSADPFRPQLADLGISWEATIPSNPDGTPQKAWAPVRTRTSVRALDNGQFPAEALPKVSDEEPLGLAAPERTALQASVLAKFGLDYGVGPATTLAELAQAIDEHLTG